MLPDQLFTAVNIAGVGVATAAITVVTNALYKLMRLPQKWTAFGAALVIAYLVVVIGQKPQWYDWVLAFFNACLLFCSALGVNEVGGETLSNPGHGFADPEPFFKSWVRRG